MPNEYTPQVDEKDKVQHKYFVSRECTDQTLGLVKEKVREEVKGTGGVVGVVKPVPSTPLTAMRPNSSLTAIVKTVVS
jgi:hypothetical protein